MPSIKTLRHQEVLFGRLFEELTQIRIDDPERPLVVAQQRKRRRKITDDGRLNLLGADYPARRVVKAAQNPMAMADREDLILRIIRILSADAADGVVTTIDIIEDLLLMHDLMQSKGLQPFLDEKLLIASLNRGGLQGASWEINDPITGPRPAQCRHWCLDGVKMLLRICDQEPASLKTLGYTRDAINEANSVQLPFFLEPLPVVRTDSGLTAEKTGHALAKLIGVVTALGDSSRYLWLKLPYCEDFATAARATTSPILITGGESMEIKKYLDDLRSGMNSAHNVRGTQIGRNVLYTMEQDPVELATLVHELVHKGTTSHVHGD